MKPMVIIILITIILIAAGCLTLNALESESRKLDESLSELEEYIDNQDWKTASEKLEEFHGKWDRISSVWSMLIDHYEIDSIELVLSQLASYIRTKDKKEALSQMSALKALIKHIPEKEAFNLKNIF